MNPNNIRIQFTCYGILTAEAIVESYAEADKLWSKYSLAKYRSGKTIGGAAMNRADLPRIWNVKVGEHING